MRNRYLFSRLATFLLGLLTARPAQAGMPHVPCQSPFVYSGAAVNVVVLPYKESATLAAGNAGSGTRLSLLIEMDVLSHILEYGSVGAIQMEATDHYDELCKPEIVGNKLLAKTPGAEAVVAQGNGLVLVWGLIYEEDDDLYIQTFASFQRRERTEDLTFSASNAKFTSRPSSQLIAFAPRRLSKKDLQRIDNAFQHANIIRQEPRDDAPGETLRGPDACATCTQVGFSGFWVNKRSGEWLSITRINSDHSTKTGWIHASAGLSGESLDRALPELDFIEGAVGYLRSRIDADARSTPDETRARATAEQLNAFVTAADAEQEPMAVAVAGQLTGIAGLLAKKDLAEGLAFAQPLFEKARALVPYNAEAITLATLSDLSRASLAPRKSTELMVLQDPRLIAQRLAQASILDPANAQALTNLRNFYSVVLRSEQVGPAANRLDKLDVTNQLKEIDTSSLQPAIKNMNEMNTQQWIDPARLKADPKQMKLDVQEFKKDQVKKSH